MNDTYLLQMALRLYSRTGTFLRGVCLEEGFLISHWTTRRRIQPKAPTKSRTPLYGFRGVRVGLGG